MPITMLGPSLSRACRLFLRLLMPDEADRVRDIRGELAKEGDVSACVGSMACANSSPSETVAPV